MAVAEGAVAVAPVGACQKVTVGAVALVGAAVRGANRVALVTGWGVIVAQSADAVHPVMTKQRVGQARIVEAVVPC